MARYSPHGSVITPVARHRPERLALEVQCMGVIAIMYEVSIEWCTSQTCGM